jgi:hypothetical protein
VAGLPEARRLSFVRWTLNRSGTYTKDCSTILQTRRRTYSWSGWFKIETELPLAALRGIGEKAAGLVEFLEDANRPARALRDSSRSFPPRRTCFVVACGRDERLASREAFRRFARRQFRSARDHTAGSVYVTAGVTAAARNSLRTAVAHGANR